MNSEEEYKNVANINFDHPNAMDWDLILETLEKIKNGEDFEIPNYNFKTCRRDEPSIKIKWHPLILFEGIFCLYEESLRNAMDLK